MSVFNTENVQVGGVYDGTRAVLIASGPTNGARALRLGTQQLQVSYMQDQRRFYTLDGPYFIMVKGRVQGQAGIAGIVAASSAIKAFLNKYGDICQIGKNVITLQSNQNDCAGTGDKTGGLNLKLFHCLIPSVAFTINAQDTVLSSQVTVTFTHMDLV